MKSKIFAICVLVFLLFVYVLQDVSYKNEMRLEIISLNNSISQNQKSIRVLIKRCNFLRYQISNSNIRLSTLENERDVSEYLNASDIELIFNDVSRVTEEK